MTTEPAGSPVCPLEGSVLNTGSSRIQGPREPSGLCAPSLAWHRGGRAGLGSLQQEAGCLHGKQRLRGDCGASQGRRPGASCVSGSDAPSSPAPAALFSLPRAACAACGWRAAPCLHVVGEAVHAISSDLVSRLAGTRGQPRRLCPALPHPTALSGRGLLAGSIGPLTSLSTLSPSKLRPIPHPFNKQPLCQAVCSLSGFAQGKQKLREGLREPLGSDRPHPPALPLTSWGTRPSCCAARVSSLWL